MKNLKLIIFFALIPLFALQLISQEGRGNGRVTGKVSDEEGNPLGGVEIVMQSTSYNFRLTTKTDAKGKWGFTGFGKDNFKFTFTKEGYTTLNSQTFLSGANKNPKQEITMKKFSAEDQKGKNPMAVDDESKALFKSANALYKEKKYSEAVTNFEQFITKNPQIYKARVNLGNCYMMMKQYDKAVAQFLMVIEGIKKDDTVTEKKKQIAANYSSIGEAYMARNLYDKAAEYYTKSMEAAPPTDPAIAFNVAEIMFNAGKTEEAIKLYSLASKLKPDFALYYSKLGYAYLNKGDIPNALKYFEKFLQMAPKDPQAASIKDLVSSLKQ